MEEILGVLIAATVRIVMAMISLFVQLLALNADVIERRIREWRNQARSRDDNKESLGNTHRDLS